jgi:hypothetical protein
MLQSQWKNRQGMLFAAASLPQNVAVILRAATDKSLRVAAASHMITVRPYGGVDGTFLRRTSAQIQNFFDLPSSLHLYLYLLPRQLPISWTYGCTTKLIRCALTSSIGFPSRIHFSCEVGDAVSFHRPERFPSRNTGSNRRRRISKRRTSLAGRPRDTDSQEYIIYASARVARDIYAGSKYRRYPSC